MSRLFFRPKWATNSPSQIILVNIRFLSPVLLVFYSTIAFLLCLPVLPVDIKFPMTIEALFFWLTCFAGYLVGTFIGAGDRSSMLICQYRINPKKVRNFMAALVLLGFIGTILLFVDRYLLRGVSLVADSMENRDAMTDSKSSGLSLIGAAASSFGILSYVFIWVAELSQIIVSRWLKLMALLSVLSAIFISVQMGSRSLMLVVVLVHLFVWFFVYRVRGGKVRSKHILMILSILVGLAIISAIMMVWRLEIMGLDIEESVVESGYAYTMSPSPYILEVFQNNEILNGLFSLVQYVFHGIYEFNLLFNNFRGEHTLGSLTFWLPIKVISLFTGGLFSVGEFHNTGGRGGIFTTFAGPIYVDFGLISPLFLIMYGAMLGLPFRFLQKGRIEWLPAVAIVATCSLIWPVVNIFTSASGTYLLVASLAFGVMGKRLRS